MNLQDRLTPYDSELFMMVQSLTGKEKEVTLETDGYWMTVRLNPKMDEKTKDAIRDAVVGRLGDRIISEEWPVSDKYPNKDVGIFHIKYGTSVGGIVDADEFEDGDISVGNVFFIPETSLRGLMVFESNFPRLVRFVGNGQWERKPDGKGFFHFLNASGTVYCDAPEGSYLVWEREGLYRVATKEEMKKFAMM